MVAHGEREGKIATKRGSWSVARFASSPNALSAGNSSACKPNNNNKKAKNVILLRSRPELSHGHEPVPLALGALTAQRRPPHARKAPQSFEPHLLLLLLRLPVGLGGLLLLLLLPVRVPVQEELVHGEVTRILSTRAVRARLARLLGGKGPDPQGLEGHPLNQLVPMGSKDDRHPLGLHVPVVDAGFPPLGVPEYLDVLLALLLLLLLLPAGACPAASLHVFQSRVDGGVRDLLGLW
mmetsp:Transcript_671/g.1985  ORF Transcript_671/g.1985 Transcript_671/m.1985 type:complete len:237 (-) Transcript_671:329-1039(-)